MTRARPFHGLVACAAACAVLAAAPSFAGEINGNGDPIAAPDHANSICVYSGLNDDPWNPPYGRTQNYGHVMRFLEIIARFFNPGDECRGGL